MICVQAGRHAEHVRRIDRLRIIAVVSQGAFNEPYSFGVNRRTGERKRVCGARHVCSRSITVNMNSVDFGMAKMDEHAKSADIFDVAKYPTATFTGKFSKFNGATPTEAQGTLTLHGVTKPVTLTINSFMCKPNPMTKKEVCGADASTTFNRADFGVSFGEAYGFKMGVTLQIQVEGSPAG
jgi:polyisoprenoid-binding protein YceI